MRKTKAAMLIWAARWKYPTLWLSRTDRVRHGELHWQRLVRDKARREMAWEKIRLWNERAQEKSA